jgi:triacylglycerol lipase
MRFGPSRAGASRAAARVLATWLLVVAGCNGDPSNPLLADAGGLPDAPAASADLPREARRGDRSSTVDSLGKGPPYPIILAHGFFGFDQIGPLEYFYKVKEALVAAGYDVHVTSVDPFNSSTYRGEQLLKQVKTILATTGAAKIDIIAHSQGGFDARYVAAKIPTRVGAIITVATPHLGAKLADILLDKAPGFSKTLAQAFFKAVSRPFYGDVASDTDVEACLEFLSTDSVTAFNASYPPEEGVAYYAIGGRSNLSLAKSVCYAPKAPSFISKYDSVVDPVDTLLVLTALALDESVLSPVPNDGIVQTSSTKWGTWLGCIPADHWDEVGQLLGDSPGFTNGFDYIEFYKDLASFLASEGF